VEKLCICASCISPRDASLKLYYGFQFSFILQVYTKIVTILICFYSIYCHLRFIRTSQNITVVKFAAYIISVLFGIVDI